MYVTMYVCTCVDRITCVLPVHFRSHSRLRIGIMALNGAGSSMAFAIAPATAIRPSVPAQARDCFVEVCLRLLESGHVLTCLVLPDFEKEHGMELAMTLRVRLAHPGFLNPSPLKRNNANDEHYRLEASSSPLRKTRNVGSGNYVGFGIQGVSGTSQKPACAAGGNQDSTGQGGCNINRAFFTSQYPFVVGSFYVASYALDRP